MEDVKQTVRNFRKDILWVAVVLIAAGVLFLVFPDSCSRIICYLIGGAMFLGGVISIVTYLKSSRDMLFSSFGLVRGTGLVVLGIFLLINPEFLIGFLSSILGIILIVDGTLKLQYAVDLLRLKVSGWVSVLLLAITAVILGVLVLLNPFATARTLAIFIGIALAVDGISDLGTLLYVSRCVKKLKKKINEIRAEADAIDAEILNDD